MKLPDEDRQQSLNHEESQDRANRRNGEVSVKQKSHIDRRVAFAQFPNEKAGQRDNDHDERARKDRRGEPIEIIALIKNGLHPEKNDGEQQEAHAVEARDVAFNAAAVNQRTRDAGDRQSDDNIRVEEGTPSEVFGPEAAHEDTDRKGHHAEDAPDSDAERSFFRRIFAEQHSLSDRENDTAGKPEEDAHRNKRPDGVGYRAEVGENGVNDERGNVDAVIADSGPQAIWRLESRDTSRSYDRSWPKSQSSASRLVNSQPRKAQESYSLGRWTGRRHSPSRPPRSTTRSASHAGELGGSRAFE